MKQKEFYLGIISYKDGSRRKVMAMSDEMLELKIDHIVEDRIHDINVVDIYHAVKKKEITYEPLVERVEEKTSWE